MYEPSPQQRAQRNSVSSLNVLYLDFDGVLHPEDARMGPRGPFLGSPPGHCLFEHAALLATLLAPYPDVRIVLSTSWAERGYEYARRRLPLELADRCIGSTFHTKMDRAVWRAMSRGEQVLADVRRRQPSRWLAIDDVDEGWGRYRDNVVITCPVYGISSTSVHAQLVERLQMFCNPTGARGRDAGSGRPEGRTAAWREFLAPGPRASKGSGKELLQSQNSSSPARPDHAWNYRAIRFEHGEAPCVAIHEVYYEAGKPVAYADIATQVVWFKEEGTDTGLKMLDRMREALEKPVLVEADFQSSAHRLLGTLRGSDIPADFDVPHARLEHQAGEGESVLDGLESEMTAWDGMPAVGRERSWEPAANRYPLKTLIALKRMRRGAHLDARSGGATKRARMKEFLRRADSLQSLKGRGHA